MPKRKEQCGVLVVSHRREKSYKNLNIRNSSPPRQPSPLCVCCSPCSSCTQTYIHILTQRNHFLLPWWEWTEGHCSHMATGSLLLHKRSQSICRWHCSTTEKHGAVTSSSHTMCLARCHVHTQSCICEKSPVLAAKMIPQNMHMCVFFKELLELYWSNAPWQFCH